MVYINFKDIYSPNDINVFIATYNLLCFLKPVIDPTGVVLDPFYPLTLADPASLGYW